ncbi:MAG: addiction module protein [Alphaproteobacteria bacterium]
MASMLSDLLRLPPDTRAELAVALWESLPDAAREAALALTPDEATELDRRWAEHLEDPASAMPWDGVRKRLARGE